MTRKKLFIRSSIGIILFLINTISFAKPLTIKFAVEIYPPFTTLDSNKKLQGFEIDIAEALCKKIEAKCDFIQGEFKNVPSTLENKQFDAWINAITINQNRQTKVLFTKPYFSSTAKLIATKNSIFNGAPTEIKGKTIGAYEHECYIEYLKKTYGSNINIKAFPSKDGAFLALKDGKVDAVIDDGLALRYWRFSQKDPEQYRLIGLPAKYSDLVQHKYGIAVAKNNYALVKKLNHAIDGIKSDGTYNKIVKKYFIN